MQPIVSENFNNLLGSVREPLMVLDSDLRLTLANPGADRIIGMALAGFVGEELAALPRVGELADEIRAAFNEQAAAGAASRDYLAPALGRHA